MWFVFLLPFVAQSVRVDQVNGSWALVELWDGALVDLPTECLGSEVREGSSIYMGPERMEVCVPGYLASRQGSNLLENAQSVR